MQDRGEDLKNAEWIVLNCFGLQKPKHSEDDVCAWDRVSCSVVCSVPLIMGILILNCYE